MQKSSQKTVAAILKAELERLKLLTDSAYPLTVVWLPCKNPALSGKVENFTILIFEETPEEALNVLRHEFIDFVVSQAIRPYEQATVFYKSMVNAVIEKLSANAYSEKELAIEELSKLVSRLNDDKAGGKKR
jgi:hypothetical protein